MMDWIEKNKEWLFSGIGISLILLGKLMIQFVYSKIKKIRFPNDVSHINKQAVQDNILSKVKEKNLSSELNLTETQKISDRFKQFLDLLNQGKDDFTIARLARIMKAETAWELKSVGELERIFNNQEEPSLDFIQKFCGCFGLNEEWLIEGKRQPFVQNETPQYFSPYEYFEYFKKKKASKIYFIMSESKFKEAFFILKYADWHYEIIQRVWHISSYVGAGGSRQLYDMYRLINELRKCGSDLICYGCILDEDRFNKLNQGGVFPSHYVRNTNPWWDDLTDVYHKYPIAQQYLELYGEEFVRAQGIIRSQIELYQNKEV